MSKTIAKSQVSALPDISFESLMELARKKQNPDQTSDGPSSFVSEEMFFWIGMYAWMPFLWAFPLYTALFNVLLTSMLIGLPTSWLDNKIYFRFIIICLPFLLFTTTVYLFLVRHKELDKKDWNDLWSHPLSPTGFFLWVKRWVVRSLATHRLMKNIEASCELSIEVLNLLPRVFEDVCREEENHLLLQLRGQGGLSDKLTVQIQKVHEQQAYWEMRNTQEQGNNPQVAKTLAQTQEIAQRLHTHRERLEKVEAQIKTMFTQFRAQFAGVQTHVQDTIQLQALASLKVEVDETQRMIEETIQTIVTEVTASMTRLRDQFCHCLTQSTVEVAGALPTTGDANQDLAYIDQALDSLERLNLGSIEPKTM